MRVLILALAMSLTAAQWSYFYPETVTSISCTVRSTTVDRMDMWAAEAHANRIIGDWDMTLGYWPMNRHGYREAADQCEKWRGEAQARVLKATVWERARVRR